MAAPPAAGRMQILGRLGQFAPTTPGRIASGFVLVVLVALLAVALNLLAAADAAKTIRTIGSDAEPSVVLALQIGEAMGDLDSAAADDALADMAAAGTSKRWRDRKADLDALVIQASRNITYDDEITALQGVLRWTGEYQAALADARNAADPARPFISIQRLQWSHRLLHDFALPEANALAAANRKPLEAAYATYRAYSRADGLVAAASFALLIAVLAVLQVFLTRRTRRLVNLPLAVATVLGVGMVAGLFAVTATERETVRSAKTDSYDSLDPLYAAKSAAAALNTDLALWLLDPAARPVISQVLDAQARTLLDLDWRDRAATDRFLNALTAAQALERQGQPAAALAAIPKKTGLLGAELANITFGTAERDPASEVARNLIRFLRVADQVRDQAAHGGLATALQLRRRDGVTALNGLAGALAATILVNQAEFDRQVDHAQRLVRLTPAIACGVLAAAVLLAAAGLWQRYREYA